MRYIIHPIVMGTKEFDQGMMTYQHGYGRPYTIPIYCWYIEDTVEGRRILVDTGEMHPIQSEERERAIGGPIHTFEQGLARFGLVPADIDVVIHTHLHADHCENDYKCENARFFIHEKELETIADPHPLDYRYVEDYIFEIRDRGQIQVVRGQGGEILPGIEVLHTPAHTPGGMSVLLETSKGRTAITGFCVIQENFDPPVEIRAMEMEVIPPGTNTGPHAAYDMMIELRDRVDHVIPLHEPAFAAVADI